MSRPQGANAGEKSPDDPGAPASFVVHASPLLAEETPYPGHAKKEPPETNAFRKNPCADKSACCKPSVSPTMFIARSHAAHIGKSSSDNIRRRSQNGTLRLGDRGSRSGNRHSLSGNRSSPPGNWLSPPGNRLSLLGNQPSSGNRCSLSGNVHSFTRNRLSGFGNDPSPSGNASAVSRTGRNSPAVSHLTLLLNISATQTHP